MRKGKRGGEGMMAFRDVGNSTRIENWGEKKRKGGKSGWLIWGVGVKSMI